MRYLSFTGVAMIICSLLSCQGSHEKMLKQFEQLKKEPSEQFKIVYAYTTYLSTARGIEPSEAIPLINELISYGRYPEARYCIDNLKRNGIQSCDLLALRGLCYYNEMQPGLALKDLEEAIAGDPGNTRIQSIIDQVRGVDNGDDMNRLLARARKLVSRAAYAESETLLDQVLMQDKANHGALYLKGLNRLHAAQYDSALHFMQFARSSEDLEQYSQYVSWIKQVLNGDRAIRDHPGSHTGYMQKSQALATMNMFEQAQSTLTAGLEVIPENMNLMLARALVWVQEGRVETARNYLLDLEMEGIAIDPALKKQILQGNQ
jgi:tetratricopeptide (TPR) repeat protein